MPVTNIVLTSVTACVECGFMQPAGFRGGTPVNDVDNPDVRIDTGDSTIPEHVDERYNVWASPHDCPVCENHFYHRLDLPMPSREQAAVNEDSWFFWGDL